MGKDTPKDIALTTKNLEDAGIKSALNQNDLIEIVVQEHEERVHSQVTYLNEASKGVQKMLQKIIDKEKEKFFNELVASKLIPEDSKLESVQAYLYRDKNKKTGYNIAPAQQALYYIHAQDTGKVEGSTKIQSASAGTIPTEPFYLNISFKLVETVVDISHTKTIFENSIQTRDFFRDVHIPAKTIAPVISEAEKVNKEVLDFIALFPNGIFNPNKIAREARTKLNKKLLKSQAPDIAKQLQAIFSIEM